ncbi:MAG: dihydrolipoyl dehydrogenase [Chloroflexi bacterium]|nr:dihydrolipoyl dehydrogenase [Chloroflexota bacterium]
MTNSSDQRIGSDGHADVAIIGGGPGGYVAAIRAGQLGAKTVLIEKASLGGTCLNEGCIPTKARLETVEHLSAVRGGLAGYGITVNDFHFDFAAAREHEWAIVQRLVKGVQQLLKGNGVQYLKGTGSFRGPNTVDVEMEDGTRQSLEASKIVIATGSQTVYLPIPGIDGANVIDSRGALFLEEIPKSIVIIGGGVIGVEFAQIFARLGTQVYIVELLPRLIPMEDEDASRLLQQLFNRAGIKSHTNSKVTAIGDDPSGQKTVTFETEQGPMTLTTEKVLVAIGRKPFSEGLNLDSVGVKAERGRIIVDDRMRTSIPHIYAIGDVIGGYLLAHVASTEGEVAVENALGHESRMDYKIVPRAVYTSPEVASVGLTEKEAKEKGYAVKTGRFPFAANSKAMIHGQGVGFVKIVAESKYGEILGATIVGPRASDLISEISMVMKLEGTLDEIIATIHPHPTTSEAIREAALYAEGRPIHTLLAPQPLGVR